MVDAGIAIAGIAVSVAAVVISAMKIKYSNNGQGKYLAKEDHDKMCRLIQDNVDTKLENIIKELIEIKSDIRQLHYPKGGI